MQLLEKNQHTNLAALAWVLAKAKGDPLQAVELAKHFLSHSHPSVERFTRAAVEAIAFDQVDGYRAAAGSFVSALIPISEFDTILPSAHRLPLRAAVVAVTVALNGGAVAEGGMKPISKLELDGGGIDPQKAVSVCVISDAVERFSPAQAIDFLNGQLRVGVAGSLNMQWLLGLISGIVPVASTGDFWADFAAGLVVVAGDRAAKVFAIFPRQVVIQLAMMHTSDGLPVFSQLRVDGGIIAGVQVLASDNLPADSTGPLALIINADALALADEPVTLHFSRQADLVMDSAPASGAQAVTSLWQTNSAALLVERQFGSRRLRASAVHVISGANYSEPLS